MGIVDSIMDFMTGEDKLLEEKESKYEGEKAQAERAAKKTATAEIKFDDMDKHMKDLAAAEAKNMEEIAKINDILKAIYKEQEDDYEIPDFVKKIA